MAPQPTRLKSGRWRVRWVDSTGKRKSASFDRKVDADKWSTHVTRARQLGELAAISAAPKRVGETGIDLFKRKQQRWAPATYNRHRRTWNRAIKPFAITQISVNRLTADEVDDWIAQMSDHGIPADERRRALTLLRSAINQAVRSGHTDRNVAAVVDLPKKDKPRRVRKALSPSEVERLRVQLESQGRHRDSLLIAVMYYAGLRPAEALALFPGAVKQRSIVVELAVSYGQLKEPKAHVIGSVRYLGDLGRQIKSYCKAHGIQDDQLMFAGPSGQPWTETQYANWERRIFKPAAIDAGFFVKSKGEKKNTVTPYSMRHSFGSLLIAGGRSVPYVATQMRNSAEMVLRHYAHEIADLDPDQPVDIDALIAAAR